MRRSNKLIVAALLAAGGAAQAAPGDTLATCRAIKDSAARLACYDGLPLAAPAPAPPPPAAAQGPAAPAPAGSATAQSEASRFGLPATKGPAPVETMESRIDGHFEGWYPGSRIQLANGSVWQVTDNSSRFANLDNPRVTVRRGALGSFFLDIDGVNPAPRVRRIQ